MANDGDLTLKLTIRADAAPVEVALRGMVRLTREAAAEMARAVRAGIAGAELPAPNMASFDRVVAEVEADLGRLHETARQPIQIPPLGLPPPVVLPPVEPPVIPPLDTKPFAVVKAEIRSMLDQPFSSLTVTLAEVTQAKQTLDREMQSAATTSARREVARLTADLEGLEAQMRDASRAAAQGASATAGRAGGGFGQMAMGVVAGNAITAATAAVSQGFRAAADAGVTFQQQMADLSAITGIAGTSLDELGDAARASAVESGIAADQQAEAFKLLASNIDVASMGGIDGLQAMGREVVMLSVAAQTELKVAADATAGAINQFGLEADQAARVVNLLAAGAKEGGAEVPDLAEALRVTGAAASGAKLTIEQTVAALEVMSGAMIKGSDAGTSFRGTLGVLQEKAEKFKEAGLGTIDLAANGLSATLRQLAPLLQDQGKLIGLFGNENQVAAQYLIANVDALDEMTVAVTGTNTAQEQAEIQMDTLRGSVALLKTALSELALNGFDGLGGAARSVVLGLRDTVLWLDRNWSSVETGVKALALAGIAYGSYRAAALLSAAASAAHGIAVTAAGVAGIVMAGETGVATTAMLAFNAAVSANPLGLLLTVIGAAVGAWVLFGNASETAADRTKRAMAETRRAVDDVKTAISQMDAATARSTARTAASNVTDLRTAIAAARTDLQEAQAARAAIRPTTSAGQSGGIGNVAQIQAAAEAVAAAERRLTDLQGRLSIATAAVAAAETRVQALAEATPTPTPTAAATPASSAAAKPDKPDGPTPAQIEEARRRAAAREIEMDEAVIIARREADDETERHRRALTEQRLRQAQRETEERARLMGDELAGRRLVLQSEGLVAAEQHRLRLEEIADEGGAARAEAQDRYDAASRRVTAERQKAGITAAEREALSAELSAAEAERDAAQAAAANRVREQSAEADQDLADQRARNGEQARRIDEDQIARTRSMMEQRSQEVARAVETYRRIAAEARRAAEAFAREVERYASRALDTLAEAAFRRRDISDDEAAAELAKLKREEDQVRQSLRRREGDRAEHEARLSEIARQRADYEKEVEADRRNVFERSYRAIGALALKTFREEGLAWASKELSRLVVRVATEEGITAATLAGTLTRGAALVGETAASLASAGASMVSAVASQIASVVKSVPFPFNLALIPLGVGAVYAAYQGAKGLFGFQSGGYTGEGAADEAAGVVHRGEYVFDAGVVRGQATEFDALREAMRRGVTPSQVLAAVGVGGYNAGGYVETPRARAASARSLSLPSGGSYATVSVASAPDLSGVEARIGALVEVVARQADELARMKQQPAPVVAGGKAARRLEAAASLDRSQTQPSRVRRIQIQTR